MANRDADGLDGGPDGGRAGRALLWVGVVGAAVAAAGYAVEGRYWLVLSFAVVGVSMALRHPRLSSRSPRA